jgi:dihydroflavonol-4-reductase
MTILNKEMPLLPNIYMVPCDVRDTALAHLKAMLSPEAKNYRHIIASSKEMVSFKDLALIIDSEFKQYNVPKSVAPNFFLKLASVFNKTVRMVIFSKNIGII